MMKHDLGYNQKDKYERLVLAQLLSLQEHEKDLNLLQLLRSFTSPLNFTRPAYHVRLTFRIG